jgi:uncharacterized protein YecA (UPF0149 family)
MFANVEESKSIMTLIIRHWNDVKDTLNQALDEYQPLIFEHELDGTLVPIMDEWCVG